MVTRHLFAVALLYLLGQSLLGRLRRKPVMPAAANRDGEPEGSLIHRYIRVESTLTGRVTDVNFHYVESPLRQRECIVFLHGFMDTWRVWHRQLAHLGDRYHLIAFDLKGAGQSSMCYPQMLFPEIGDAGGDYSLDTQADELVSALDHLGVRRFTLVTLDLGTIIGDILAGKYPERIQRYLRCQQPLVGHFRSSIPQGRILRSRRGAKRLTSVLEAAPGALLRILYGRTGWRVLDRGMKRSKHPMPDAALASAIQEASRPFTHGPRAGRPGAFACSWAGLYQHNRDYMRYLRDNLAAYGKYCFPVMLVQGTHDIAMPPGRFDGSTGMAFKRVRLRRWCRTSAAEWVVLSRPFSTDGQGLGNGYVPWGELIPGCTQPMPAAAFFPNVPDVALRFVDAGHFLPLEAPEAVNRLLDEFLANRGPTRTV